MKIWPTYLLLTLLFLGCSSNEPDDELPLGTFQVKINGDDWQADFAIGNNARLFVDPFSSDSMQVLGIVGTTVDNSGRFGSSIIIP